MHRLPLYDGPRASALNESHELPHDPACRACSRNALGSARPPKHPCMRPESATLVTLHPGDQPRTLVVVLDAPDATSDMQGRPLVGSAGSMVRELVKKHWRGRVVFDHGVRCAGVTKVGDKEADACRPYLARSVANASPERIVVLGRVAARAVLGRSPDPFSAANGYGWHLDAARYEEGEDEAACAVPVYLLPNPALVVRNRFLRRDFERDFVRALTRAAPDYAFASTAHTHRARTADDALAAYAACDEAGGFAFDVETAGRMWCAGFQIDALTLWPTMMQDRPGSPIPRVHGVASLGYTFDRAALTTPAIARWLVQLFGNDSIAKFGADAKYDVCSVSADPALRTPVRGPVYDVRLIRKLLAADVDGDLATMAEFVGMGGHKREAQDAIKAICPDLAALAKEPDRAPLASGKPRAPVQTKYVARDAVRPEHIAALRANGASKALSTKTFAYHYLKPDTRDRYNALDTCSTALLGQELLDQLAARPGLVNVHEKITRPASWALARMEEWGIAVDRTAIELFDLHLDAEEAKCNTRLAQYGADVNWSSTQQLAEVLYGRLGLPVYARTTGGAPSTDEAVLERLAERHPLPRALLDLRHVNTMRRYAGKLIPYIRDTGRVHANYLLDGTGTGRPSGKDPNLLNIPRAKGSPEGRMARNVYVGGVSKRGRKRVLVEGDMSQQELRVAAMLSNDATMIALFNDPTVDFHAAVLDQVCELAFGVKRAELELLKDSVHLVKLAYAAGLQPTQSDLAAAERYDELRSRTKGVVFGAGYGKVPATYAREWEVPLRVAERAYEAILGPFKGYRAYMASQTAKGRIEGGAHTWWDGMEGRWRPLYAIGDQGDDNKGRRENAERSMTNTPVQGTAAEYVTASLAPVIQLYEDEGLDAKLVCTVYDSILTECDEEDVESVVAICGHVMTSHNSGPVRLKADFKVGRAWGEMKDYVPKTAGRA